MGKFSRDKGQRFERWCVAQFKKMMPGAEIKRGLQSRSGADVADVQCPWFWVECKASTGPDKIKPGLRQAIKASAGSGLSPIVISKQTSIKLRGAAPIVTMEWWRWAELVKATGWEAWEIHKRPGARINARTELEKAETPKGKMPCLLIRVPKMHGDASGEAAVVWFSDWEKVVMAWR